MAIPNIGKNTIISTSIGTLMGLAWAIWIMTSEVQSYMTQIAANTSAIQQVSKSLRLGRLDSDISDRKEERRTLRRALKKSPGDELLEDQIETLDEEIEYFIDLRKCVIEGKEVCR